MTDDSVSNSTKMDLSDEDDGDGAPPLPATLIKQSLDVLKNIVKDIDIDLVETLPSSLVVTDFDEDFDKSRRKLAAYTQLLKDGLEKSAGPYL